MSCAGTGRPLGLALGADGRNALRIMYTARVCSAQNSTIQSWRGYVRRPRRMGDESTKTDGGAKIGQESTGNAPEPEWPEHFPPGCPDACSSRDVDGSVFRLVREPRNPRDSQSWLERGLGAGTTTDCERAGLSCCCTVNDIRELQRSVARFRNRLIASATLTPEHGKIGKTGGPGHHSLWLRRKYLRNHDALFVVAR